MRSRRRSGFTLIELLIVILIILAVSAVALPVVLPALSHRQVSEAARALQGALAGARDVAMHANTPAGIRLLPDPAFPVLYLANGQIDPTQPLAVNRIIPIAPAPTYQSGRLTVPLPSQLPAGFTGVNPVLVVIESVVSGTAAAPTLNEPSTWAWNIRVGDKLQINGAGLWYTVVGPMVITPQQGNSEQFINWGLPGTVSPLGDTQGGVPVFPEFLFLVNGLDDNANGWIDEGYDGVDNNGNGTVDDNGPIGTGAGEWEVEAWPSGLLAALPTNAPYAIQRRPAPSSNAREIQLPTNVVIDLTTWASSAPERSQLPPGVVNPYTGCVDILLNPNGTIVPTTVYSTPASFGMSGAFFQLWIGERSDVAAPSPAATSAPYLPVGVIDRTLAGTGAPYGGATIGGEYRVVTLFTRTGQVTTADDVSFDNPAAPANGATYNAGWPFLASRQGSK